MDSNNFTLIVEFGATFFGVLLGYIVTHFYDNFRKKQEEKGNKISVLSGIQNELDFNRDLLRDSTDEYNKNGTIIGLTYFNTACYNSFIGNGDFSLISTSSQVSITVVYNWYKRMEKTQELILYPREAGGEVWANRMFGGHLEAVTQFLDLADEEIKHELTLLTSYSKSNPSPLPNNEP